MWNKRKEDEYPPKASQTPVSSPGHTREAHAPMTTAPATGLHAPDRSSAVIGKSVVIKGQIFSREDLTVDGEVEGALELQENRLTIGPHGKVHAGVKAKEIVVLGQIHGNVEVGDKIDIRKDARLVGDIKTSRIVIEDGAYFKGTIDIMKAEVKPAPAPPKPAPAPVVQPLPGAAAGATTSSATAGGAEGKR